MPKPEPNMQHPVPPIEGFSTSEFRASSPPPEMTCTRNAYKDNQSDNPYKEESNLLSSKVRTEVIKAQAFERKPPEGLARIGLQGSKELALQTARKKQYAEDLRNQIEMKRSRSSSPAKTIGRKWSFDQNDHPWNNVLSPSSLANIGQQPQVQPPAIKRPNAEPNAFHMGIDKNTVLQQYKHDLELQIEEQRQKKEVARQARINDEIKW